MTDTDTALLASHMHSACVDWDGKPMADDAEPRVILSCRVIREAADHLTALERERDEARARLEKHSDYSIQLQRIIEAVCRGNDLRQDSAELFHHKMVLHLIPNYKNFPREPAP